MMSQHVCLALAASMTVVLHGCGGGGPAPTPAPTPAPSPGPSPTPGPATSPGPAPATDPSLAPTTTTVPLPTLAPCDPCGTPWTPEEAVEALNSMYMSFDEANDTSQVGVTMSMASNHDSFSNNLHCAEVVDTGCWNGTADCRISASLFNHKVMVTHEDDATKFFGGIQREVGYVFDQTLTEEYFGKCSYIWDGASMNDLNSGCGIGAPGSGCDDHNSAFWNQCGSEEKHDCARADNEVSGRLCKESSYGVVDPPTQPQEATCFYEMPALIYGDSTTTNNLRDSMKRRVALQGDGNTGEWNEVVIDTRLLVQKLHQDPAGTVRAFVCNPDLNPDACNMATRMRDDFLSEYKVNGIIPVISLDTTTDFTTTAGPFRLPAGGQIIA